jgi:hypothetical protein
VVAFAVDNIPAEVTADPIAQSSLRRYLDAGGKIVWTGVPPALWPNDPATGRRGGLGTLTWDRPTQLLGVGHERTMFDQRLVRPTVAGLRWGLSGRWRDGWAIDPAQATEVLALDDWGLAASWWKSYGGPRGTGFVRAPGEVPRLVYYLAEYRPAAGASR